MTIAAAPLLPQTIVIGVLALQGAFIEHIHYLQKLRPEGHVIKAIPIRSAAELATCHALVIPGGESTVIQTVAANTPGLLEGLKEFVQNKEKAVWGTCAGMILMACEDGIGGGKYIEGRAPQRGWGGIEGMKVWRNLYGTQLESFECHMQIPCLSSPTKPFNAIFIRAPAIHSLPPATKTPIEVLAAVPPEAMPDAPPADTEMGPANHEDLSKIFVRQGKKMATAFHPELTGDIRIHEYWVNTCVLGQ